jgi:hypothetical protein
VFAPHLILFGNKKNGKYEWKKIKECYKIRNIFHDLFKNEMGILANKFTPGGSGSSQGGNTVRRIFKMYRESARITGVNENIILRFYVIMQNISSRFELNTEEFNKYKKKRLNYFLKNTRGFACQSIEPIFFLGPFCLLGNCPRKPRNLETRIASTSEVV